ncbi:carboxyl transferase domain-containing protein, partial [Tsukamurella paurometabola]
IGGADLQAGRGVVDVVTDTEAEAVAAIRAFLSYLPACAADEPLISAGPHDPGDTADRIATLVPASMRRAYDVVDVI